MDDDKKRIIEEGYERKCECERERERERERWRYMMKKEKLCEA